jgi:molybdopterin-guanine dinucleotide biosynthesis protein A
MNATPLFGTILAGGQARRLGGIDKGLVDVGGKPMIEWIIERLGPQVGTVIINANRNHDAYARYGCPVVSDTFGNYAGPLAGFAAAMDDGNAELAVAHDGDRLQPVYALLPVILLDSLRSFLEAGDRKIDLWYARHRMVTADFSDHPEAFLNLNRPQDMDRLLASVAV